MSRLQALLIEAKTGLRPWEPIPRHLWAAIAARCGDPELAELTNRIAMVQRELADTPAWDGDSHDDIHGAIFFFQTLLTMSRGC